MWCLNPFRSRGDNGKRQAEQQQLKTAWNWERPSHGRECGMVPIMKSGMPTDYLEAAGFGVLSVFLVPLSEDFFSDFSVLAGGLSFFADSLYPSLR
jgi:hypothetical protein